MNVTRYSLWENVPCTTNNYEPWIEHYAPKNKITNSALIIIPGSGYISDPDRPKQEGERVAKYFCDKGINVFVLRYRVFPDVFPCPILDGRRAVRYVRYYSEKFGINKEKVAVMGYSAGGHLTASLFTYHDKTEYEGIDEIDNESYIPDYQILCYPVISLDKDNYFTHQGSADNLLSLRYDQLKDSLSHEKSLVKVEAPTFIWHNFDDELVGVENSLLYAKKLSKDGTSVEMHIFPDGGHGKGLPVDDTKDLNHIKIWTELLDNWLKYKDFY